MTDFRRTKSQSMLCMLLVLITSMTATRVVESAEDLRPTHQDVTFAHVERSKGSDDPFELKLDLYLPSTDAPAPLVVWVHGGAWRRGSKQSVPITGMVDHGFAIASVGYRLSVTAPFPAQVHDIKAAIRFLRASAGRYHLDPRRVAIAGASAGGHLAALVGVSTGVEALEGELGHQQYSSAVGAIVSFYGAANLQSILRQSTPHGLSVRVPALKLLLGDTPENRPALAELASPVAHVDAGDPPLLLLHGDQDPQMPINQAHELHGAYQRVSRPVEFDVIHGAGHGGAEFYTAERLRRVASFLRQHGAAAAN